MSEFFRTLVDGPTLAAHLGDPAWLIVDCRFTLAEPARGELAFASSRIPGARYAHLERDLAGAVGDATGRHPLPDPTAFAATLGRLGVQPRTQVVVYDDSLGSIAARLWWLLRWCGHPAVALLDGGWPAWRRRAAPIECGPPSSAAGDSAPPYPVAADADGIADTAQIESIRGDNAWRLIDARPEERYCGEHEPIDRVAGHIPGSVWRTFEDNLEFDGSFLDAPALRADFLACLGSVPPARTVHTCGSGVTACHNLLAMEHAGLPGSKLYVGSWSAWISNPERPVATGKDCPAASSR